MTKRELLDTWFEQVWKAENTDAIYKYYAPDGQALGLGEVHQAGPDDFVAFQKMMLKLIRLESVSYSQIIEEGDWISYVGALKMIDRATGNDVHLVGGAMCKILDDKIVIAHNTWDFLGLFDQLGLALEGAFMSLLSGQKLIA